mgnify:CR=1 FL=1
MKNVQIGLILVGAMALSACASTSLRESHRPSSNSLDEGASVRVSHHLIAPSAAASGNSLALSSNSTPPAIEYPIETFYAKLPDCGENRFSLKELMVDELRLSNIDMKNAAATLSSMGYPVINHQGQINQGQRFSCEDLPVIVIPSHAQSQNASFGGDGFKAQGASSTHVTQLSNSSAADFDRFLVYFHPSEKQKFAKLDWLVKQKLDVPAAQVYIETMVLEVREEDSEEFGIQYDKADGDKLFSIGGLSPGDNTVDFLRDTFIDPLSGAKIFTPGYGKRLKLKALIDEGKAEILSRPSVLALSNRQAMIQIVDVIQSPELRSTLSQTGGLQVSSYQFTPLLIGITLNLRPRVSAGRDWLTLEIDATVESEDDENNGQVFAPTEEGGSVLLAEKQGSSSKKVRTFARIPDRTPIIIGGLVSKKIEESEGKVPMLSKIPGLGKVFTSTDNEIQKREVIIVLTPYILAEDAMGISTHQPRGDVLLKNKKSVLFE